MEKKYWLLFIFTAILSIGLLGQSSIKIAISKGVPNDAYQNYYNYIHAVDSTVEVYDLYALTIDSAMILLENCDGILLTGGTDIYPGIYGKETDTIICWEPDHKRDSLEFMALEKAIEQKIPVLGICRGMQLINVHFGGTLHTDIPTDLGKTVLHQIPDKYKCFHKVNLEANSWLRTLTGITYETTNSNHHQGINMLGEGLLPQGKTKDGLIESVTISDQKYPFLLGVQWHPERMDYSNPLAGKIGEAFINSCKSLRHKTESNNKLITQ